MVKALFFDIDGTLVSFETHKIPVSTIEALTLAKKKGIKIYISTGRPYHLINVESIKHLIDGYITANGAYNFIGERIISCNSIPLKDVLTVIALADKMDFACMVVGDCDFAVYNTNVLVDQIFRQLLNVSNLQENVPIGPILEQPILQLTPIINQEDEVKVMSKLFNCVSNRWHPDFTDITKKNVDKGNGLISIITNEGLDVSETMAFGDGGNDISIIKRAGIGVAMGNANNYVQSAADYVTDTVDNDGIKKAFLHFGLI